MYRNKETSEVTDRKPFDAANEALWEYFPCKFSAKDYNFVAKRIRERLDAALAFHNNMPTLKGYDKGGKYYATEALVVLALDFAKAYTEDSPKFDPRKFLDACSPNVDLYPLSELWED